MSKNIYDVTLLELLPDNLRSDPDIIAASRAVDQEFWLMAQSIKNCLTFAGIDNAESGVVDHIAAEMNVDFYVQTLPLATRRAIVKNGYVYKYLKGTPYIVKQVIKDIFADASVEEWFEYAGQPFYFRVSTETNMPDITVINEIFRAVNAVKNKRSWLESLAALKHSSLDINHGMAVHQGKYKIIQQS